MKDAMNNQQPNASAHVAALLAQANSAAPPPDLRVQLLAAANRTPSAADRVTPSSKIDVYANQAADFHALAQTMTAEDWMKRAAPYQWSNHGLLAHTYVGEVYSAQIIGLPTEVGTVDGSHHLRMGSDIIDAELLQSPSHTLGLWWERIQETVSWLRSQPIEVGDQFTEYHGWPFPVEAVLVARGFELWTHADDFRRSTGRPIDQPSVRDLRAMSSFSMQNLELILMLVHPNAPTGGARIVLTGPGGGTYTVGNPDERVVTAVVDVVDYCRVAADRLEPRDLVADIDGDRAITDALWEASRTFAM